MAKTTHLGLELTTDADTRFSDWRKSINGVSETREQKSNMEIIDEFAGRIYGVNGSTVLEASKWNASSYTLRVSELGDRDAILFSPASASDKEALEVANVVASASAGVVVFTAKYLPELDIRVNYFIMRGK